MVDFSSRDDVKRWLDGIEPAQRRREVAVVIAARAALRATPLLALGLSPAKRESDSELFALVSPVFRAATVPWATGNFPARGDELKENAHASFVSSAHLSAVPTNRTSPVAAAHASSVSAARSAAAYGARSSAARSAATDAAADAANAAAPYAALSSAAADAAWIEAGRPGSELAGAALWLEGAPGWATDAWRELKSALLASHNDWRVWTDWYEARLAGDASRPVIEALEIARAKISDETWRRGPRAVNAEILRLIDRHTPRPAPEPELGPALVVSHGRLTLSNSASIGEFGQSLQSALHTQLQRKCPGLLEKTRSVGNTHPGLHSIVSEYAELIAQPIETLDVVALWAVGTGLLANSATLGRLPQAGVMAEPLEPEHLALLLQVATIHGGFIQGFELGRTLTDRADQSRLSQEALAAIMPPARDLLGRWSRAAEYVEARTRTFFGAIAEEAVEPSWRAARAGYSAYAVTKDSLIALGKWVVSHRPSLVGVVLIAGIDPAYATHIQLAAQFLLEQSQTILSFSEPFPELKFWLGEIIDNLKKDKDFRGSLASRSE